MGGFKQIDNRPTTLSISGGSLADESAVRTKLKVRRKKEQPFLPRFSLSSLSPLSFLLLHSGKGLGYVCSFLFSLLPAAVGAHRQVPFAVPPSLLLPLPLTFFHLPRLLNWPRPFRCTASSRTWTWPMEEWTTTSASHSPPGGTQRPCFFSASDCSVRAVQPSGKVFLPPHPLRLLRPRRLPQVTMSWMTNLVTAAGCCRLNQLRTIKYKRPIAYCRSMP